MHRDRPLGRLRSSSLGVGFLILALACHAVSPMNDAKLGGSVRDVLARDGAVDVMVALVSDAAPAGDTPAGRAAVARLQDSVLATVDTADFRVRQRYATVPALAGTLRSRRALDLLLAHPLVRRVDLDPGGGGTTPP